MIDVRSYGFFFFLLIWLLIVLARDVVLAMTSFLLLFCYKCEGIQDSCQCKEAVALCFPVQNE